MFKLLPRCKKLANFFGIITLFMFSAATLHADVPANDSCGGAIFIPFSNGGFSLGLFTSSNTDITSATLQIGETFAPSITVAGLTKKSIWYKFSLPTNRSVKVSLLQPGSAIQAGNVGFTVYKTNSCIPGSAEISTKFSPIETFGSSSHPCADMGDYLVQVSSNNSANGPVFITIEIAEPSPADYDKPGTAYKFPNVPNNKQSFEDYLVQCQTIDGYTENCLPNSSFKDYTKSTWHTFKTSNYFDYLNIWLGILPGSNRNTPPQKIGYRIYEGDCTSSPLSSLIQIGGCDSIITDLLAIGRKNYSCGSLKSNTTYTIQLLFHKDFVENIRFGVEWNGTSPTNGPLPVSSLTAPNKMGTLNGNTTGDGFTNSVSDVFACNSRHSQNNCPKSMPVDGVLIDRDRFNLSSFVSFNFVSTSTLTFNFNKSTCSGLLLIR